MMEQITEQNIHATSGMALNAIYQKLKLMKETDEELFCPLYPDCIPEGYKRD